MSVVSARMQEALCLLAQRHPQPVSGAELIERMQAHPGPGDDLAYSLKRLRAAWAHGLIHPAQPGPTWDLPGTRGAGKMQEARWAITPAGRCNMLRKAEVLALPHDSPGRWADRALHQGAHLADLLLLALLERPAHLAPSGRHLLRLAQNSANANRTDWTPSRQQRACLASLVVHRYLQPAYSAELIGPHDALPPTLQWWQLAPAGLQRAQDVQQALLHSRGLPAPLNMATALKPRTTTKVPSLQPGSLAHHILGQLDAGAPLSAPLHGPGAQPTATPQALADTLASLCLAGYARERAATPSAGPGQATHQLTPRGAACLAALDTAPPLATPKQPKPQGAPQPPATHFGAHNLPVVAGPRQPQLDTQQPAQPPGLHTPLRDKHCHRHVAASRRGEHLHFPDGSHCPAHDAAARAAIEQRLRQRAHAP